MQNWKGNSQREFCCKLIRVRSEKVLIQENQLMIIGREKQKKKIKANYREKNPKQRTKVLW